MKPRKLPAPILRPNKDVMGAVLRFRDVHPESRTQFFPSRIPDPNFSIPDPGSEFFHTGSQIRIKEFKYFNQGWKKPGFKKKKQPSGFFWFFFGFFGFIGFFWVFLPGREGS
jgi:hypothetical protein